jgi:hypothetical protein
MTDDSTQFTPTDMRRAAALLSHYQAGDLTGMFAIMSEAEQDDASADLAAALCALFFELCPWLKAAAGGERLRELTRAWAAAEAAS